MCANKAELVLHFPVLHFPPPDLPIIVVLHFPVITFTPIVLHWSSFYRSSIFSQPVVDLDISHQTCAE